MAYATTNLKLTKDEEIFIKNNPIIKVHNELDWAPYNYVVDNKPYGYSIDYIRLLSSKVGLKVEFVNGYSWNQFLQMIQTNKIDVMLNITKTDKRTKYLNFTTSYIKQIDVLFTKKGYICKSLKDFNGKTLAIVKGFYEEEILKEYYQNIKLIIVKDSVEALKLVSLGKVDGTINNLGAGTFLIAKYGLFNVKPTLEIVDKLFHINLYIATNKINIVLRNILEKGKQLITKDEQVRLTKKWLSHDNNLRTSLTLNEENYLKKKEVIKICIDPNWMPFEKFDKDGRYIGMSADYFQYFENIMKLKFEVIQTKSWTESLEYIKDRKCDILSLAMPTPKRRKYLNFTQPYIELPIVIATKHNVSFINNISFLENKSIAIPKGYAFSEIIRKKYPKINLIEFPNLQDALEQVSQNKVFGCIGALATIGYVLQNESISDLKISGKFDEKWELGVGVRNDDEILFNIMEKTVKSVSEVKQQEIFNRWIQIIYQDKIDYGLLYISLYIMFFIGFFSLYKEYINKKLRIELEKKIKIAVDEMRKKDEILFHQSKLAQMGEMLENIAHQWRQPLSKINSSLFVIDDILESKNIKDKEIEDRLIKIEMLTKYLSNTINDFRYFFNDKKKKENFLLKELINQSIFIIKDALGEISIELYLNNNIYYYGYKNELQQVIIIVLNNAIDAFFNKNIEDKKIKIFLSFLTNYYCISICDNAGGVNKNSKNKIFDPYFTTKQKNKGSGIGLYMAQKIIQESFQGKIHLKNSNKGACFEINIYRFKGK